MTTRKLVIEFDSPDADRDCRALRDTLMKANWGLLITSAFDILYKPQLDGNRIWFVPRDAVYELVDLTNGTTTSVQRMMPEAAKHANMLCSVERSVFRWHPIVQEPYTEDVWLSSDNDKIEDRWEVSYGPVVIGWMQVFQGRWNAVSNDNPGISKMHVTAPEAIRHLAGIYLTTDQSKKKR